MGEKLQDMVGASSCTTSNAGMSTDRGSDEQDGKSAYGQTRIYPAWGSAVHLECDIRSGTSIVKRRSALVDDWLLNPRVALG